MRDGDNRYYDEKQAWITPENAAKMARAASECAQVVLRRQAESLAASASAIQGFTLGSRIDWLPEREAMPDALAALASAPKHIAAYLAIAEKAKPEAVPVPKESAIWMRETLGQYRDLTVHVGDEIEWNVEPKGVLKKSLFGQVTLIADGKAVVYPVNECDGAVRSTYDANPGPTVVPLETARRWDDDDY